MIGHYHKRGPEGLPAYDPDAFEPDRFDKLLAEHAGRLNPEPGFGSQFADFFRTPDVVNDFEAAGHHRARRCDPPDLDHLLVRV